MSFTESFIAESVKVLQQINLTQVDLAAKVLAQVKLDGGRLFIIGSGGGAGHASHAVCDFRKLCDIESYAPYDNVSELTARVNDEGWEVSLSNWLKVSRLRSSDALLVFSVGGGDEKHQISTNLVNAMKYAKECGAKIVGIVGKTGGYANDVGDAVVIIRTSESHLVTPITEGFQAVIWHLLVSHPMLKVNTAKWESVVIPA